MTTEEKGGGGEEDYKEQNDEAANLGSLRKAGEGERDKEREIEGGRGFNENKFMW